MCHSLEKLTFVVDSILKLVWSHDNGKENMKLDKIKKAYVEQMQNER